MSLQTNLLSQISENENLNLSREDCKDVATAKLCNKWKNKGKCSKPWVIKKCIKTCGKCDSGEDDENDDSCEDKASAEKCLKWKNKGFCDKQWVEMRCAKTCDKCGSDDESGESDEGDGNNNDSCEDKAPAKNCIKWNNKGLCDKQWVKMRCEKTCGICGSDEESSESDEGDDSNSNEDGTTEAPSPPSPIDVRT